MTFAKASLLLLLAAPAAYPEIFSFGAKLGHPMKDVFNGSVTRLSGGYTIGPTVELHFPASTSVEFDILYRPAKYRTVFDVSAGEWRFPLLVKYRFGKAAIRPFMSAGACWQRFSGGGSGDEQPKGTTTGGVVAGGLEMKVPLVRVSGELRYTRWGAANFRNVVSGLTRANQNQVEVLFGVTF